VEASTEAADALDRPLGEFLDQLAGDAAAPGGGSTAGVCVGMAAGLVACVARLSHGWDDAGSALAQAEKLRSRVGPLIDLDARAFDEALRTLSTRAEVDPGERDSRLEQSLARAAEVPLAIGEAAADIAELAALVSSYGTPELRADAASAAILAEAAAQTVEQLVEANLATTKDDARLESARQHLKRARVSRESITASPPA
jgi:formiminotetrahydrofolate cyclodeaminase